MNSRVIWFIAGNLVALIMVTIVLANKNRKAKYRLVYLVMANFIYIGSGVYFSSAFEKAGMVTMFYLIIALLDFLVLKIMYYPPRVSVDEEKYKQWHDDSKNWKLGLFYFNPEDKRIFPPKRMEGMGWTINFANADSVLVMMTIIAFIVVVMNVVVTL